jgi:putative transferase (TIGR04331 family)
MITRYLVTTAIEETWPKSTELIIFLGKWCNRFTRREFFLKKNFEVEPYHWDDRIKLYADYIYLQKLYEKILIDLSNKLNQIHNVNYSLRYWRILVGPWLGYFIQILFDRWSMLDRALEKYRDIKIIVLDRKTEEFIPSDMSEFEALYSRDDWNEFIYSQILNWMRVDTEAVSINTSPTVKNDKRIINTNGGIKYFFLRLANILAKKISKDDEHFFISTYLGIREEIILHLMLGQFPKFWRSSELEKSKVHMSMRNWILEDDNNDDIFSGLVRSFVANHIPIAYLEGYSKLIGVTKKLPWPKNPKSIYTSSSYSVDDIFKAWAADKVELGTPFIIGQHGGNDGVALWSFTENHQISISDYLLSWGWSLPSDNKVVPIANFKAINKKIVAKADGYALMLEMALPQYSYHMYSIPVSAGQWEEYFGDQIKFVKCLSEKIRNNLLIRLFPHDFQCDQADRWKHSLLKVNIDNGDASMEELMREAKICIGTYNATTYLETMSLNFPTIIFWNPKYWELREGARPYFDSLRLAGIFHDTPESAANKLAEVWSDVPGWWNSELVQKARAEFCHHYARNPKKPLRILRNFFIKLTKESELNTRL